MDVSLDDYIGSKKTNFKVNIGNPNAQGQSKTVKFKPKNIISFQNSAGNKQNFQNRNRANFSVSVRGKEQGVKNFQVKTFSDAREKLAVKDAREKLTVKDAREKLVQKSHTVGNDARQKIVNIQIRKGTFDARSKIRTKKQVSAGVGGKPGKVTVTGLGNAGPVQTTGNVNAPNALTRTVNNNNTQMRAKPGGGPVDFHITRTLNTAVPPPNLQLDTSVPPPNFRINTSVPPPNHGGVQLVGSGLQVTRNVGGALGGTSQFTGSQMIGRTLGNPGVVDNDFQITRNITQEVPPANPYIPIIQVGQKHYQQPMYQPTEYKPLPQYEQYPPPESVQPPPQPQIIEYVPQVEEVIEPQTIKRTIGGRIGPSVSVKKTVPVVPPSSSSPLKRKAAAPLRGGGPLKLARPSGAPVLPVIDPDPPVIKKRLVPAAPMMEEADIDNPDDDTVLSPLQGFKVAVTNLHQVVSQDDIIELFGAIGAMKKARLMKAGTAEVVYVKKEDAAKAIQKYHNRELDGQPMQVKMVAPPPPPKVKETSDTIPDMDKPTGQPLKFNKKPAVGKSGDKATVEASVLHKALFKLGSHSGSSKPVTFTVKI